MNNDTIEFVTTFSNKGYDLYGQALLDSWVEHSRFPLHVWHESQELRDEHKLLEWHNLDDVEDRTVFIRRANARKILGDNTTADPRFPNAQSVRFCHKVFALTEQARVSHADWLVWIDADVILHDTLDDKRMQRILQDAALVYLGRPRFPYTECGFVAYRIEREDVIDLLEDMRSFYTAEEIWKHPVNCRHDSFAFDLCRTRSRVPKTLWRSLSDNSPDPSHVWPHTLLAEFSSHNKGLKRKEQQYNAEEKTVWDAAT